MALTDKQKAKTIFYLGWPGLTIVPDSTLFNSIVNDRLEANSASETMCAITKMILSKLEGIDACLEKAKCRLAASQVDQITTNENEISKLLKERKRCIRELSQHLDIGVSGSSGGGVNVGVCV